MNSNSRILIYLSIMTLVFSCVLLLYAALFYRWNLLNSPIEVTISPGIVIITGVILSGINGIAANVLSDQISKNVDRMHPLIRWGVPIGVFLLTLVTMVFVALAR